MFAEEGQPQVVSGDGRVIDITGGMRLYASHVSVVCLQWG